MNDLDENDTFLLRRLIQAGCNLRVSELVNENRQHGMSREEVAERLERLQALGYVTPAYWSVTAAGSTAVAPRFRASTEPQAA